ncbi:TonB-dependent receptor [Arcicella rosea]|uniref:Iron complex outermembrane receptor protein n=1 Tax=Arcicella rosea TaxID=502909 RepID=A0A841EWH4_9BACT|nr:TonB-dependent receptor [Arcicella rosea]MBB6004978.1 iron complex outermembrane receptor protein [Arcicella rosea]
MKILLSLLCFINSFALVAQTDSILKVTELQPVIISSSRFVGKDIQTPLAVTVIDQARLQTGQSKLSLFDALGAVPGVFAMNSENFAQDLRISIRGFGARASFGIRGLKVVMDGIPESIPDGTAKVGNLDMGLMERMEVIKGPTAGLYGNASGGVISLFSETPKTFFAEAQATFGSFGFQRLQFKTGQEIGKVTYFFNASRLTSTGYRNHSALERNFFNGKVIYKFSDKINLSVLMSYVDSPKAEDPGGLTQADIDKDRRQARQVNIDYNAYETFKQSKLALIYDQKIGEKHQINARAFYLNRDFNSQQATKDKGQIAFKRDFSGGGFNYQFTEKKYRLKAGLDIENQQDNRQRYDNLLGERGILSIDQIESFRNIGAFILQEYTFNQKFRLSLNTRFDDIQLKISDKFLTGGDESSSQSFQRFSPMLGFSFAPTANQSIYTNISSSFETPSLNELSNNPLKTGGFNPNLSPQQSRNFELGYKGILSKKFRLDLALFTIEVQDEIVPYQIAGQGVTTYFRNAGLSNRKGIETGITYKVFNGLTAYLNYTFSDFKYKEYQTTAGKFDGNTLPGIPKHNIYSEFRYFDKSGFFGIVQLRSISKIYADDANTVTNNGYFTANVRVGYRKQIGALTLEPFIGINNLTNTVYNANVQINATANRYFEPASGSFLFGGISVRAF